MRRRGTAAQGAMKKILVAVDGSLVANRAARHALDYVRRVKDATILLVNVQHTLERWYKHGLLNSEATQHLRRQGEDESAAARALLDQAGVVYDFEILFGQPAEVITRVAKEHQCEGIVIGTRGLGDMENVFLGSVAHKVIQLAEVPVTLVK
jgi:nucleotide-binding universal stress UspA family protein